MDSILKLNKISFYKKFFFFLFLIGVIFTLSPRAAAQAPSYPIVGMVRDQEAGCARRLNDYGDPSGMSERNKINNSSAGYGHIQWISLLNAPTVSTKNVQPGEVIDLQLNSLLFYCATVVQPSQNSTNKWPDPAAIVSGINPEYRAGNNPISSSAASGYNDGPLVLDGGLHHASLNREEIIIQSCQKTSGSGEVLGSGPTGTFTSIRNPSYRYAPAAPKTFQYKVGNTQSSEPVIITCNFRATYFFDGGGTTTNIYSIGGVFTPNVAPDRQYRIQGVTQYQETTGGSFSNFPAGVAPHSINVTKGTGPVVNNDSSNSWNHGVYDGNITVTSAETVTYNGSEYKLIGASSVINTTNHSPANVDRGPSNINVTFDGTYIDTDEPTTGRETADSNSFVDARFYYQKVTEPTIKFVVKMDDGSTPPDVKIEAGAHDIGVCQGRTSPFTVSSIRSCTGTKIGSPSPTSFRHQALSNPYTRVSGWTLSGSLASGESINCNATGCNNITLTSSQVTVTLTLKRGPANYVISIEARCPGNSVEYTTRARNVNDPTEQPNYTIEVDGVFVLSGTIDSGGASIRNGGNGDYIDTNLHIATAFVGSESASVQFGPCATAPGNCPSLNVSPFFGNPFVTRTLADKTPSSQDRPTSYTSTRSTDRRDGTQTWSQNRNTNVDVKDISNPRGSRNVILPDTTNASNTEITLDYTTFVDECPFDRNQPRVEYDSVYNERDWDTNSNYSESCPYGYNYYNSNVDSSQRCRRTYTTSPNGYCSSSDATSGGTCYRVGNSTRTSTQACSSTSSGPYSCTYLYNPHSYHTYQCPSGYSPSGNVSSGTTCTRYEYSYSTKTFTTYWSSGMRYNQEDGSNGAVDFPLMEPCWDREFSATTSLVNITITPDMEQPTTAKVTAALNVDFGVTQPTEGTSPMRLASSIKGIGYVIESGVTSGDTPSSVGSWSAVGSGTRTISATSPNKNADGTYGLPSAQEQVNVSVPPLRAGDRVCFRLRITTHVNGDMNRLGDLTANRGGSAETSRCSLPVVNWPYVKVLGNDVLSGGSFGNCTVDSGAGIRAFNRGSTAGTFRGSSVQYAALALGSISGFGSAGLKTSGSFGGLTSPDGLTFANVGSNGSFSAGVTDGSMCLADYFTNRSQATQDINSGGQIRAKAQTTNSNQGAIEYYYYNGSVTLPNAVTNVQKGSKKVFYIDGTLTIRQNIQFDTTWNDRKEVPYIMFVARNIDIDNSVTQLDGVYVAQPYSTSSGGRIRTCYDQTGSSQYSGCSQPLTINGSFSGKEVLLQRTRGSVRDSVVAEGRTATGACSNGTNSPIFGTIGGPVSCAAEVFSFSPEIYLSISDIIAPEQSFIYDSYVVLPPGI